MADWCYTFSHSASLLLTVFLYELEGGAFMIKKTWAAFCLAFSLAAASPVVSLADTAEQGGDHDGKLRRISFRMAPRLTAEMGTILRF